MAEELFKSKHAFGDYDKVDMAIQNGIVDSYDVLFLKNGDKAIIGWVDKNGNKVIVEGKERIVPVDELPEQGETGVLYIYEETGYIWNGEGFVAITQSADVTELETRIETVETELATKVDEVRVTEMIAEVAGLEIVEF